MSRGPKLAAGVSAVLIGSDVLREIRQHARNNSKTEVCGVLIGREDHGAIEIEAGIAGVNADQAGAHVTFTQDTWEHIYKVKDRQYPEQRILGWYHSHPGFGVFLSDHDTFIHKNFFSSPGQVAWVYDPHSDEEGCFGWVNGRIERLPRISVVDARGGEAAESSRPEPVYVDNDREDEPQPLTTPTFSLRDERGAEVSHEDWLKQLSVMLISYLGVLALGFALCWYFYPRIAIVAVPVDPITGQPLVDLGKLGIDATSLQPPAAQKQGDGAPTDQKPQANQPEKGQHERQ